MLIALDTETTGKDFHKGDRAFAVFTCTEKGEEKHWEWPVNPYDRVPKVSKKDREAIKEYLEGNTIVYHYCGFDTRALQSIGIYINYPNWKPIVEPLGWFPRLTVVNCAGYHDTLLASHVCDSEERHGLKELGIKYLDLLDDDEADLKKQVVSARRIGKQRGFACADGDAAVARDYWLPKAVDPSSTLLADYGSMDARRTIELWLIYREVLEDEGLHQSYERERHLVPVTYRMESQGLRVISRQIGLQLTDRTKTAKDHLRTVQYEAKEVELNVDSPIQMRKVLYGKLRLPIIKTSPKSREPSTDKETLKDLFELHTREGTKAHHLLDALLKYREQNTKIKYLKSYQEQETQSRIPVNGDHRSCRVLFPSFNQTGTKTVRYSSSNPNGQNIDELLRAVFGPRPGCVWYCVDYDQLELRIFATVANEKTMLIALENGDDIHQITADRFDIERKKGKTVNFAWQYGASTKPNGKLATVIRMAGGKGDPSELNKLYPDAAKFINRTIREARKAGWVYTLNGYRLSVHKKHPYKGVDYICQGTAGDIIKNAMIEVDAFLSEKTKGKARIVLNVHDELIIEVDRNLEEQGEIVEQVAYLMSESGKKLRNQPVTTPVEVSRCTRTWAEKESLYTLEV